MISLSIMIVLLSCKKDEAPRTIAEGHIYHSGTKMPLDSVKVYLYDGVGHSSGWFDLGGKSKGSNSIDSTTTDSNGFFHLELDGDEPVLYPYKRGYSFEYAMGGAAIGIVPLKTGENKNLRFELDAWANLNPWFFGTKSLYNDTLIFDVLSNTGVSEGWDHTFIGQGPNKYSSFDGYPMKGDTYKVYRLKFQVKGVWHEKIDSVYVPSFTTYNDTIFY